MVRRGGLPLASLRARAGFLWVTMAGLSTAAAFPGLADDEHISPETADGPAGEDKGDSSGDKDWDITAPFGPTHTVKLSLNEATWMTVSIHEQRFVTEILGDLFLGDLAGGPLVPLTSGAAWDTEPDFSPDGRFVAYASDEGGNENIWLVEVATGKRTALTTETEARFTAPTFDPSGEWVVARRRTVDTRSIGVTELWRFHIGGGSGVALTSKDNDPHAGEVSIHGDHLYFSTRYGRFEYGHNPVGGLWAISDMDLNTGKVRSVVQGSGSAVRPVVHPDGKQLAFVSRDRARTLLELVDLSTGRRRVLADWLDHDQMEGFALHGVYPSFDWTDNGNALVVWAGGKLWRVDLDGRRTEIPFSVDHEWRLHDVPRANNTIPDTLTSRVIRWPVDHPTDGRTAFSAFGELWVQKDGKAERISTGTGYAPAWSPDGKDLAWVSWTDCPTEDPTPGAPYPECGGRLHVTRGKKTETLGTWSEWAAPAFVFGNDQIAVWRGTGGTTTTPLANHPMAELVLFSRGKKGWTSTVLTTDSLRGGLEHAPTPVGHNDRVYYLSSRPGQGRVPAITLLNSVSRTGTDTRTHLRFDGAQEIALSPDARYVAWLQDFQVWVAPFDEVGIEVDLGGGAVPKRKLSSDGGAWLTWSSDSTSLSWMHGNTRNRVSLPDFSVPDSKPDAPTTETLTVTLPRAKPQGTVAYTHANVWTMADPSGAQCADCTLVVDQDRIVSVVPGGAPPAGATVVDLTGRTIIPGLIDVHAHLHYSAGDVLPAQEWRYLVNLDFGVTTVHDPSASTELVFTQAERVDAGLAIGPRVYSTGFVLYGALSHYNAETPDADAARAHVQRLKDLGALSVKVYQQSRRDQRQWYIQACRELEMVCTAEGGGDIWMNLGMVADGMHSVEHALSRAPLYADVQGFYAASPNTATQTFGSAYTPTLNVAYGGMGGQHWYWQHLHPFADNNPDGERLLRHWPRRHLDEKAWRRDVVMQDGDWNHEQVARDAAEMFRAGQLTTLGAHGELQGLGVHWELWSLAGPGAMTPIEALFAATHNGARHLGLDAQLGSLEVGKLADFVVLTDDPTVDIHNSTHIELVVRGGQPWNAPAHRTK